MKKLSFFIFLYLLVIIALFLYSYTQVDLSLTLSRASIFQIIEKGFQYIGYFNRPLSTIFYCSILGLLFVGYFLLLYFGAKKKINLKKLWLVIGVISVILTFSYNAFSYDLFNYIFAAKVVVHYHQNPYLVSALQFPKDPMLSFMHWTHNTYQYGFVWLGMTLPFYFLGAGFFLPTFFLFKILGTLCFVGSIYFFQKILRIVAPEREVVGTILFALNPLVIIELLVSSHNDSSMMFLGILGIYLVLKRKWLFGFLAIILSALTKQVTVLLLIPSAMYMLSTITKRKFFSEKYLLWLSAIFMAAGFVYAGWKLGVQPWYAVWFVPFCFLLRLPKWLYAGIIGLTLGLLLRYVPFLWQGDWNGMALIIMPAVTIITPIVFIFAEGIWSLARAGK